MIFGRRTRRRPAGTSDSGSGVVAAQPEGVTTASKADVPVVESVPRTVDLRVLLLTSGDDEPSAQAWSARLEGEGVPFDRVIAGVDPLIAATLESGPQHGRYQAVILATDSLVRLRDGAYESSLNAEEWATLRDYLRTYSVRQISA